MVTGDEFVDFIAWRNFARHVAQLGAVADRVAQLRSVAVDDGVAK
jgi:hypothetical protein